MLGLVSSDNILSCFTELHNACFFNEKVATADYQVLLPVSFLCHCMGLHLTQLSEGKFLRRSRQRTGDPFYSAAPMRDSPLNVFFFLQCLIDMIFFLYLLPGLFNDSGKDIQSYHTYKLKTLLSTT